MKNHSQTIIFISNPFGYGPTGTLIPIIKEFEQNTNCETIFLGSKNCLEIINSNDNDWERLKIIKINERNINILKRFFKSSKKPLFVISSLNRFAIQASDQLGIKNAMIDPLGWFWSKIPKGFELSDIYFYNNFGKDNIKNGRICIEIPLIVTNSKHKTNKNLVIFNIGGSSNPLVKGLQKNYLKLLLYLITNIDKNIQSTIKVVGGGKAINFLKKNKDIGCMCNFSSLSYFDFEKEIKKSSLVITPAGMGATFSSIHLSKPTIIFLAQNLSQIKLEEILTYRNINKLNMNWTNYFELNSSNISEKESIKLIDELSFEALENKNILDKILIDLKDLIQKSNTIKIEKMNVAGIKFGGEKVVFNKLKAYWNL